jgi:hypothetical protein
MNLSKIKAFERKVFNEAKKAVRSVYAKHNKEFIKLISEQIPKGEVLKSANGCCKINDNKKGRAWGFNELEDDKLIYLSTLQYNNSFEGCFDIPFKIKSSKK